MGLVQVDSFTTTSEVASVILGGGSSGSSTTNYAINENCVYLISYLNAQPVDDSKYLELRYTVGGTPQTQNTYNWMGFKLKTYSSFQNHNFIGATHHRLTGEQLGNNTEELTHGLLELHRAYDNTQSTFLTQNSVARDAGGNLNNVVGAFNYTTNNYVDGVQFFMNSGNIKTGAVFALYKVT
jgi:hypothetical protein